jgi:hypothetical protein
VFAVWLEIFITRLKHDHEAAASKEGKQAPTYGYVATLDNKKHRKDDETLA